MEVSYFAIAAAFWAATYFILRGGWTQGNGIGLPEISGGAMIAAVLSIGAAMYLFGPLGGLALIITVVVHEFGHVAAYRVCGHSDARFRLVPLMGGVAISNQHPASQLKDYFITLMGPGICLALMMTSLALENVAYSISYNLYWFFWLLTGMSAGLNFFNLLPLWPLDGGRMIRIVVYAFSPGLAQVVTLAMSAALVVLGLLSQHMILVFFAIFSAASAFNAPALSAVQRPITKLQAVMCLGIHLTMAAAFALGALELASQYF